jgi:oligopeptidase B
LLLNASDHETAEIRLIDTLDAPAPPRLVSAREPEHDYSVEHHEDRLIILTNSDGAEDYRIVEAPIDSPGREHWREIEPHRPGRLILEIVAFKRHLVRLEREDGLPRIVIRRFADGAEHEIAFAEEAYALGISPGYEYDTDTLRFTYSSMTTPAQVFDYDMETRERILRKTQEVPSGHDPSNYVTRRVMAPARDGETVPVSLLYRKETPLDGSAPLLLYGYGAYGMTIPASFSTTALSLVDRGFVYAVAHVRGGQDKGYRWYKGGKREKKINTFTDFIAAGEYLAREKFTSRGRIVAHGGSAGGMLMGAIANMAPDLFLGVIAEVPFVDVLTTMLDASLPLTPPEWPEWGNPIQSADAYRTIAAYSPYDNVRAQGYPHILAVAGLTDPRVTYWEPAKWVAKLRELRTDDRLLLLRTNMDAGHAGASGRFERLKEVALAYAFALKIAGLGGSA